MNYRRLALVGGVVALGVGLLAIAVPELVAFGFGPDLVSVVAALILVQALRVAFARRRADRDEAETGDPELPVEMFPPGEEFESVLEQFLGTQRVDHFRSHIREGLRSAGIAVLTQFGTYSKSEAEAAIAAGTWTDDGYAAAFLGDEGISTASIRTEFRGLFGSEQLLQRDVRHTVDAIAAVAGVRASSGETSTFGLQRVREPPDASIESSESNGAKSEFEGGAVSRVSHATGHWHGVSVVALVGIGVGILLEQPSVLLAGVVGIGFAAYARSAAFSPGEVSVSRTLDTTRPDPGDSVEITVTVTNESGRFLPDLRIVDGVPEALSVTDGSPRIGAALRSGRSVRFTYELEARRGIHTFGPTRCVARDLTAEIEQERTVFTENSLTCIPPLRPLAEPIPLRERAARYAGRIQTPSGGDGIEFYGTRKYRSGDSMSRIDWNRRSRTGELTTIQFREERAATVVIVIDARPTAYVSPEPGTPHAVDRAVAAAGGIFASLSGAGDHVGIAALSPEPCWLAPGSGVDHDLEAQELLGTHPALSSVPRTGRSAMLRWRKRLQKRLSPGTQLLFITPLSDAYGARFARQLEADGYPVTLFAFDSTADRTPGHRLAKIARRIHVAALRNAGIPVLEWSAEETVATAIARHEKRWSK